MEVRDPRYLSCKRDQIKMIDYMDKRVTPSKRVTSPTWGPPPPCKQALSQHRSGRLHYLTSLRNFVSYVKCFCIMWLPSCSFCYEFLIIWRYCLYSLIRERLEDTNEAKFMDNRLWAVSYFFESYRSRTREPRETRAETVPAYTLFLLDKRGHCDWEIDRYKRKGGLQVI